MKTRFEIDPNLPEEWAEFHIHKMTERLQRVVQDLGTTTQLWGYIDNIIKPLELNEVYLIESLQSKVYAKTAKQTYQVKKKLYELEEFLPRNFVKISRSEFVNLDYLDHLEVAANATVILKLTNGQEAFVARRCIKNLKARLGI